MNAMRPEAVRSSTFVFGELLELCGLTDGNLSRHLQVLQACHRRPADRTRSAANDVSNDFLGPQALS